MNAPTPPYSRYLSRLFSTILCLTTLSLTQSPSTTHASWGLFTGFLNGDSPTIIAISGSFIGFNKAYSDYWNTVTSSNQHSESSDQTQKAAAEATKIGWSAIEQLYYATNNKEYDYNEFQGIVMDFFMKIYTRVPSTYATTEEGQVPDGKGGTKTSTWTSQHTDTNPRYLFGSTLGTIPVNSDCSVNIDRNSPTNELGLALRYQTLAIIYTAITKNFFSRGIESLQEATTILQGQNDATSQTLEGQVFQNAVLPYLEMVMQDPFCKTNSDFAKGIICVAIKKGIIPEDSTNVNCDETFDITQSLGCTPPR